MKKFAFERNIGAVSELDPRIFIKMPKEVVTKRSLAKGSTITITFKDQTGKYLFSTQVKILSQNRIYLPKQIQDNFIEHYGSEKVPFGFLEEESEWVAQELS